MSSLNELSTDQLRNRVVVPAPAPLSTAGFCVGILSPAYGARNRFQELRLGLSPYFKRVRGPEIDSKD
jgi:hypothetical protein